MLGIEEAEQERDRDGLDPRRLERGDQRIDLVLRQRRDDGAVGADALGDLEAPAARDEGRRRVLEEVIEVGTRRAPQLQHIAEAARGNERRARAGFLENGIGHDGGGVRQEPDVGRGHLVAAHGSLEGAEHAVGKVPRGRGHLGDADRPARVVDERYVREGPADIDPDPPSHAGHYALCALWGHLTDLTI